MDLQQPGIFFYRRDKTVLVANVSGYGDLNNHFRQCEKPGLGRFLLRNFMEGVLVIDLASTTATNVFTPKKDQRNPDIVMGFVDDKFVAKFVDSKTMKRYEQEKLWKTKTIESEGNRYRDYYDSMRVHVFYSQKISCQLV